MADRGVVNFLVGEVKAIAPDGITRVLSIGDFVSAEERIVPAEGSQIEIALQGQEAIYLTAETPWEGGRENFYLNAMTVDQPGMENPLADEYRVFGPATDETLAAQAAEQQALFYTAATPTEAPYDQDALPEQQADNDGVDPELLQRAILAGMDPSEIAQADQISGGTSWSLEGVDADVAQLQAAILQGVDPSEALEATAAGIADQGAPESGSFETVVLSRTAGQVDPAAGYDTAGLEQTSQLADQDEPSQNSENITASPAQPAEPVEDLDPNEVPEPDSPEEPGTQVYSTPIEPPLAPELFARDDSFSGVEDSSITGSVAANDSANNGGTLAFSKASDPQHGSVTLNADGSFSYVPNPDFHDLDTFTYSVTETQTGQTKTQTVSINLASVNDAGTFGGNTSGSGNEDTNLTGTLTFTDSKDGATNPNFTVTTAAANGTATIDASGNWSYTPNADYNGSDSFVVSVTDDDGNTETQTISLTVNAVADIVNDTASTNEDTAVTTNALSNDSFEGAAVITSVTQGSNGSVAISNGQVIYTPNTDFNGTDSYTYTVTSGGVTETATVNVTVGQVNDAGTFGGDTAGSGDEDAASAITGTLTFADSKDGATNPNFTVTTAAANGTATIDASTGAWSFIPNADYNGSDSFVVSVTDDDGNTETQTISLTVNAVADIANDTASTNEDTAITTNVLSNDSFEGAAVITSVTQGSNGSVAISNGQVIYTPNTDFNGTDSYTYTVTSGGVTETATVNVTVGQANDAGTFGGDTSGSGNEDTNLTGTLTFADTTEGATSPNFTVSSGASNGTATINATTGVWSYAPNADYNGSDSFVVSVTDDDGNTETQTITLTVGAVVDIADDTGTTTEDTAVTTDVLSNDSFDGTPTITSVTQGLNGSVAISGGQVVYTPNADFNGTDSYTYTVTSGGVTETATVNVTVGQANDAGTFGGDTSGSGNEDTNLTGTLTFADTTDGATSPNFTVSSAASNGTATIDANGNWSYTPNADYNGSDSFVVTVTDDDGNTETQTISLTVNAVADIANDTATTTEDTAVTTDVLSNDSFDGTPTITSVTQGSNGSVAISGGQVIYTANTDFTGTDSYTHTVTSGGVTETATVNVTVGQVNDAGTFGGDTSGSGNEDTNLTGTLTFTDGKDGATTPNFTVTTAASNGTATINATTGVWSYTPNADYNGSDSFVVSVTDDDGNTETQTITLTVGAVVDIADDTATITEDTAVTTDVLSNDSFDGTPTITSVTQGSNGSVAISGGQVVYTPNADFNGTDSYTYTVTSGGVTETATVNVTVGQVNDAGTFGGDTSGSGNEDTNLTGTLTFTDGKDGATTPNFTVTTAASNGTATINATTGVWSYTPNADYNGSDSFVVSVTDDDGNTETQTISLTVNAVADIVNDTASTNEDTAVTTNALSNDSFEGAAVITSVTQGSNGSVAISNGQVIYTPNTDFNGTDSYTYTVTSGGVTETATVNVTVGQVNDPGAFGGDTSGSGDEDAASAITGTLTFTDSKDGATNPNFTVTTAAANGTATIDASGNWSYTPNADYNGSDSFVVSVTDDDGNTETQTISLTVNAVADIVNDTDTTTEDNAVTTDVLDNDTFEGGNPTITAVGTAANGTVEIVAGGVKYTPNADFNGTDSYTYTVTSGGVTETATVNVTVGQVNDAGTFGGDTSGSGNEDTNLTGTLTFADTTDGATSPNFTVSSAASNGTATIDASGNWSYTPNADYNGSDSFVVSVTDDDGNTETQTISLTVNAVADIVNDTASTNEDTAVTTNALSNDSFEGAAVITSVTQGSNGSVAISNGQVIYTPNTDFNGTDSYTYTVTSGGVIETATVNVTVGQVNDEGTFGGDTSGSGKEDTNLTGTLTFADTTDGATSPNFTVSSAASNGTATIDASGNWNYTPNADYNGSDSFVVSVTDDDGNIETQTISLTVGAVVDIADDTATTTEDTAVTTNVLSNDSFEGTPAITAVTQGTNGSVVISNGQITYTPDTGFSGNDSYTYTVTSGGVTETATVSVTVNAVSFNDANETVSVDEDSGVNTGNLIDTTSSAGTISVTGFSVDGQSYSPGATASLSAGTLSINAQGQYSFTPATNYFGSVPVITYSMTDPAGNTDTSKLTLTVNAVDDSFSDADESVTTLEDIAITGNVIDGSSVDGTVTLTAFEISGTSYNAGDTATLTEGSFTVSSSGTYSFTPASNFNGSVPAITYMLSDGLGAKETSTLNITVTPDPDTIEDNLAVQVGSGETQRLALGTTDQTGNSFTTTDGMTVTAGSGTDLNYSNGLGLGVDSGGNGEDGNRIDPGETVTFDFTGVTGITNSLVELRVKNTDKDTIKITATVADQVSSSDVQVFHLADGITSSGVSSQDCDVTVNGYEITVEVNGDIFNQGGTDYLQIDFGSAMSQAVVTAGGAFDGNNPNGYQIQLIEFGSGVASTTYPVDLSGVLAEPGIEEFAGNIVLDGFPSGTQLYYQSGGTTTSITGTESNGMVSFNLDTATYGSLLDSALSTQYQDGLYIVTQSALADGFVPDISVTVEEGGATAVTALGGTESTSLSGDAGDDYLSGGAGNDILVGNSGDDIIFGGLGNDTLTGGDDADTFAWGASDGDGGIDRITDFSISDGDVLDLSDLLTDEESAADLSSYLNVVSGTDTTVEIDKDGGNSFDTPDQVIVLEDVNTDLDTLLNNNSITVDNN